MIPTPGRSTRRGYHSPGRLTRQRILNQGRKSRWTVSLTKMSAHKMVIMVSSYRYKHLHIKFLFRRGGHSISKNGMVDIIFYVKYRRSTYTAA